MTLESLKNGKFSKNVLSKESLMRLDGGKTYYTGTYQSDATIYSCSGPKGEQFDKTYIDERNNKTTQVSDKMFPGTSNSDYINP